MRAATDTAATAGLSVQAAADAVAICGDLLRINTANDGGHPERPAAEYVAGLLAEAGVEPVITEPTAGRTSVLGRLPGLRAEPALLIHAHLDTVPADPTEWSVHPFSGEIRDGCLWGRGAVDMKDMVAMTLAVVCALRRSGRAPARDIVLAFVADEEDGGTLGAKHLIAHHREQFDGCGDAIGEVGGFSTTVPTGQRIYPIQVAERGVHWIRIEARPSARETEPLTSLCRAIERIGKHRFPPQTTQATSAFLASFEQATGIRLPAGGDPAGQLEGLLPGFAPMVSASFSDTAAPTTLHSGPAQPGPGFRATATVDGRFLPGHAEEFAATLRGLAGPEVAVHVLRHSPAVQTPPSGPLYEALGAALRAFDPEAIPVPYMLSAGTDAKWFSSLGIRCYGFAPLRLPPRFDYARLFHGIDERVPVSALRFGTDVLAHLLTNI